MRQTLRDFQQIAVETLREGVRQGIKGQLLVAPTGAGKTTIAAFLIESAVQRPGGNVLMLAHRRELITQPSTRLDDMGLDHGIIMSGHPRRRPHLPIQVGSIQTVVNYDFHRFPSLVIIDEAHRARAATYRTILDMLGNPITIGLTATPCRLDGRGLGGDLFQRLVECPQVPQLISDGYLVPCRVYAGKKHDMRGYTKSAGDWKAEDAAQEMNKPELIGDVVREWKERASGRPTIAFASTIKHSLAIRDAFRAAGVSCEHVDGATPNEEREAVLRRLAAGTLSIAVNVGIWDEGVDCPAVSCIIDDAITASLVKYLQRRGRGMRLYPGKEDCIVLDHAGNCWAHGLPEQRREWSLDGDSERRKKSPSPDYQDTIKVCPKCQTAHDLDALTCACGYVFSVCRQAVPVHKAGELVAVTERDIKIVSEETKRRKYEWFLQQQHTCSKRDGEPFSKGYAFAKYLAEFKENPKRGWRDMWMERNRETVELDRERRSLALHG